MRELRDTLGWFGLWLFWCILEQPIGLSAFLTRHGWQRVSRWQWARRGGI